MPLKKIEPNASSAAMTAGSASESGRSDSTFRSSVVRILAVETAVELAFFAIFVEFEPEWLRHILGALSIAAAVVAVVGGRMTTTSHTPGRVLTLLAILSIGCGAFAVTSPSIAVIAAFALLKLSLSAIALDEDTPGILIGGISNVCAILILVFRGDSPVAGAIVYLGLVTTGTFLIIRLRRSLTAARDEALHLAHVDPLTGLLNRRGMEAATPRLEANARRAGDRVGCLVLDLDHFKAINDRHGHRVGDEVLARTAAILTAVTRDTDIVARTGGEEFVVLSVVATATDLRSLAERIRKAVADQSAPSATVSIGAATGDAQTPAQLADLFDRTDAALYAAKKDGRNTVRTR